MLTVFWWGNLKERDCLEVLGADGKVKVFYDPITEWFGLQSAVSG